MEFKVLTIEDESARVVLTLEGELDMYAKDHLVSEGMRAISKPTCSELVLDMAGVTFLDSTGIGGLIALRQDGLQNEQRVSIQNPSANVQRLLQLTGLESVFVV